MAICKEMPWIKYMIQYYKEPIGWILENDTFNSQTLPKFETIFAQSNGYMGVRAALEERYVNETRNAFVTGTFNCADYTEVTELPNLPDVTQMELFIDNERFSLDYGSVNNYSHRLNLKNAEVTREVEWTSSNGKTLKICFGRIVSLADEHLVASYMEVTPINDDIAININSGINGRVSNTGSQHLTEGERRLLNGKILRLVTETTQSKVQIAVHCVHKVMGANLDFLPIMSRRTFTASYKGEICKGNTLRIEKISCYHTSRDIESDNSVNDVCKRGEECIDKAFEEGYEKIASLSANAWDKYWQIHDMQIDSIDSYDQLAMRYALYQLNGMVKRNDNRVGIGAKALTGEGYKGHSFWDTEMFILPHYQYTDPDTARTLLEYRWKSLSGARKKAESNNFKGAMYPWESAWLDDGEVTPLWGAADINTGKSTPILTGMIEHHITADVAWSVWQYYKSTGDDDFMARCGCEILLDTARYWISRANYNEKLDRYEILDVIGPDEYKEHVNNNAYTNYIAYENLNFARQVLDIMPKKWKETLEHLIKELDINDLAEHIDDVMAKWYLPKPNSDDILPQNDEYLNLKEIDLSKYKYESGVSSIFNDFGPEEINNIMVSKQADTVMLMCIMSDKFSEEVCGKNFNFYEAHTLHDSSLSYGTHGLLASRLGRTELAYTMFCHARDIDIGQNMKSSDEGIHSASMGGLWQCATFGFAGLYQVEDKLYISPKLPKEWCRLAFRFVWQGCPVFFETTHNYTELQNIGDKTVELYFEGKVTKLAPNEKIRYTSERTNYEI